MGHCENLIWPAEEQFSSLEVVIPGLAPSKVGHIKGWSHISLLPPSRVGVNHQGWTHEGEGHLGVGASGLAAARVGRNKGWSRTLCSCSNQGCEGWSEAGQNKLVSVTVTVGRVGE